MFQTFKRGNILAPPYGFYEEFRPVTSLTHEPLRYQVFEGELRGARLRVARLHLAAARLHEGEGGVGGAADGRGRADHPHEQRTVRRARAPLQPFRHWD